MMITLTLTDQQAVNLRGLIDLAVKSGGSQIMRQAVELDDLIMAAARQQSQQQQEPAAKANGGKETRP